MAKKREFHVVLKKRLRNSMGEGLVAVSLNFKAMDAKATLVTVKVKNYKGVDGRSRSPQIPLHILNRIRLTSAIVSEDLPMLGKVVGVCSLRAQRDARRSRVQIGNLPLPEIPIL